MKILIAFLTLFWMSSVGSTAVAARDACATKVLAQAGLIKMTSQDIVRTTDDAIDARLDRFTDRAIDEKTAKEAAAAKELLDAVRDLQASPDAPAAPIIETLCKNNLSVQKTVAQ